MTPKEQYVVRVRKFLKDFAKRNELTGMVESEDDDIMEAIDSVYDEFIIAPPVRLEIPFTDAIKYLWFRFGVIAFLLDSEAILNTRNSLPYQDGGTHIDENAKAGPYANYAINYWQKFETGLRALKMKANLEGFPWDGTSKYEFTYSDQFDRPIQ